jgi:DNA-binding transcriptional regulator YdaS (Cro superfamily)
MKSKFKKINRDLEIVLDTAGGQTALAKLTGVKQQSVYLWVKSGNVPPKRASKIIKLFPLLKNKISFQGLSPRAFDE